MNRRTASIPVRAIVVDIPQFLGIVQIWVGRCYSRIPRFFLAGLWFVLGNENSITDEVFPEHDPNLLIEKEKNYPVSFNGKLKFQVLLSNDLSKKEVEEIVSNHDLTIKNLDGRSIKK